MKKSGFLTYLKTKGRLPALAILGTLGLFLLVFAGTFGKTGETAKTEDTAAREAALADYKNKMEDELEHLCEAAAGVSDVRVMVSFSTGFQTRYCKDESGRPLTVGNGSAERALEEGVLPPAVSGVGIICRRGNDPTVQKTLTELVSTTLGIPSNRVFVTGR